MKSLSPLKLAGLLCMGIGLLFGITSLIPVGQAAPLPQLTPFPTPTPGPDGSILYTVQDGDTLWRVAAVSGITVDELRALNNLGPDAILTPGQVLLLGIGGPSIFTPTPGPTPTAPPAPPTATPPSGGATLCILLYNDENGDAMRQDAESVIPGGAISIVNRSGTVSLEAETGSRIEETCNYNVYTGFDPALGFTTFTDVPPGEYNISLAVPEGYHPTTLMNYALTLHPGDETYLDFGAQQAGEAPPEGSAPPSQGDGRGSLLLGIAGAILLLGGLLLALFANRLTR